MTVNLTLNGRAAVLILDNPPLNLLGAALRTALDAALDEALALKAERLILTGQGKTFVAGADAREFDAPPVAPHLNDILKKLAGLPIPTIAAINGAALGGGLEIALACRYRIAAPDAVFALPEVTLGIVPGAGGTQRLPRIIGIAAAQDMIVHGGSVPAAKALQLGLIDQLSADPLQAALSLDEAVLRQAVVADGRPAPAPDEAALAAARAQIARRAPGQIAPFFAIDLLAASVANPLDANLAREREIFLALRKSPQARALRHIFFAERAAASRAREFPRPASAIRSAIVVGGGNMGAAIAYALASAGIAVTLVEMNEAGIGRARANIEAIIAQGIKRGLVSAAAGDGIAASLRYAIGYANLPPADLAIEAAFEDMAVKRTIFSALEAVLPATSILATNTSYLDVNQLAAGLADPGRAVGLHFFSPAHIMKLLEIVRADQTSAQTLGAAYMLAKQLKKIPVVSGVCDGFIGNRILTRYRQAADSLLAEGASPQEVDAAMRAFGMAMGPYEAQDMSGLDIAYANRKRQDVRHRPGIRYVPLVEQLVEDHRRLGRKSGAGWYDYDANGAASPSAVVAACIAGVSQAAGIVRRVIPAEEISRQVLLAMISEACAILEEGIAAQPQDVDLVLVHGYGFPRWRGGLMHYADTLGAPAILAQIEALAAADPLSWPVSPLLARLAETSTAFASLNH